MKQMKKTVTILMLFAMLLSTCGIMASAFHVAVEAEQVEPVSVLADEIAPLRYERCEVCSTGRVNYSHTVYGKWYMCYYVECAHRDPSVHDVYQERTVTKYFVCNNCGSTYDQKLGNESRIVCKSKKV